MGSGQEIAFKIQAMPLHDAIETADTVCSIDPLLLIWHTILWAAPEETDSKDDVSYTASGEKHLPKGRSQTL